MKQLRDMTEPELKTLMNKLGALVEKVCDLHDVEKPMFAMLLFNDPKVTQYICNCDRGDVIKAMRETADRLERNDILERVEFPDSCGATGDYPEGKLHDRDEGGLNLAIGSDRKTKKIIVSFGKPTAWIGMSASEAMQVADSIRYHATKVGD